jgi:hypothetical protein
MQVWLGPKDLSLLENAHPLERSVSPGRTGVTYAIRDDAAALGDRLKEAAIALPLLEIH